MKTMSLILFFSLIVFPAIPQVQPAGYPIQPVTFNHVKLSDDFWAPRIRKNHEVTIPISIQKSRETGRIKNFEIAGGLENGAFCSTYPFDDSDVFKIIEGASFSLQTFPDPALETTLDSLIYFISLAQEDDGYLYTNRTIDSLHMHPWVGKKRWEKDPEASHELYNIGHLYEAAVAHYQATGKRTLLDVALKSADLVVKDFLKGGLTYYPGHQVIEMGLVKLYLVTGKKEYLDQAKYFLDIRKGGDVYNQAHQPVTEQHEIVGHAVRATYMYSGMADVAALTGEAAYNTAILRLWEDLIGTKYYITGGIGSSAGNEGFADPYFLPNMTAYCETCASIGNVFWNYRLFLMTGESKYFDVAERTMYNALLAGVSLSGDRFFYPNVLESRGQHERAPWFGCACCPSNVCRFLPSIPGYIYAGDEQNIYVNLYMTNSADFGFGSLKGKIEQHSEYPWNGKTEITINPDRTRQFAVRLRIPGWVNGQAVPSDLYRFTDTRALPYSVLLNGEKINTILEKGYAVISRTWKPGDKIELTFEMPVQMVMAHPKVEADLGRIALQRGPLVYCLEGPDNPEFSLRNLMPDMNEPISLKARPDLLNGVMTLSGKARLVNQDPFGKIMGQTVDFTAIPYYSWANRGPGEMLVWLPDNIESVKPKPLPTISSTAELTASHPAKVQFAVNDQEWPASSNDPATLHYHWWPLKDTVQWLQYRFKKPETISRSSVYWFDDRPDGGCRIPESWKIQFQTENGSWKDVNPKGSYQNQINQINTVAFEPVTTKAVRLVVELKEFSSGVYEWEAGSNE